MTNQSRSRYRRQTLFGPLGESGQVKLTGGRVLVCGCGALGGSVAQILARAGVGFLRLIDPDTVSLDNLHRQFLFSESDAEANEYKTVAAQRALRLGNSSVLVEALIARATSQNIDDLVAGVDVLVDGSDNFSTRFLLNEAALRHGIPFVSGGITGASGQVMTVIPKVTPCFACVFGEQNTFDATGQAKKQATNQTKNQAPSQPNAFPVLSPIVQVISAFQAVEVLKILSGNLDAVSRDLTVFDLWENRIKKMSLAGLNSKKCQVCA